MISTPPRMVIQQSMERISSFYHASATAPRTNHGDFFNTYACSRQVERSRTSTAGRCSVKAGSDRPALRRDLTGKYDRHELHQKWQKPHSDRTNPRRTEHPPPHTV